MKPGLDSWYIRIPDGRVLKAATTKAVRLHVGSGLIPPDSRVRRHPDDEWAALEWTQEFADLVKAPSTVDVELPPTDAKPKSPPRKHDSIASHLDTTRLQTLGLRRFFEELLAALDLTLVRRKLMVAGLVGLLSGLVFAMFISGFGDPEGVWVEGRATLASGLILALGATGAVLLTRMTYVELSRQRPARWTECRLGLGDVTLRFAVSYLVVTGVSLAAIYFLRHLPPWILERMGEDSTPALRDAVGGTAAVVALLLEALLWPVCVLALLLAPVLVVEECPALIALGRWSRLIWQDMNRVVVYQALAVVMALLVSLPFAVPLALAYSGAPVTGSLALPVSLSLPVFAGVACAPLFACLAVANMFIYLNLRYEYGTTR
jgi:hypothetical protein